MYCKLQTQGLAHLITEHFCTAPEFKVLQSSQGWKTQWTHGHRLFEAKPAVCQIIRDGHLCLEQVSVCDASASERPHAQLSEGLEACGTNL